ncbi:hypothetical protein QP185_04085 [Sphingomonas aerolata]|uniref:hypothetical protein n=1 Tax=Sphingomonas aerolata TaxID=185951 RepID=UPI002FE38B49
MPNPASIREQGCTQAVEAAQQPGHSSCQPPCVTRTASPRPSAAPRSPRGSPRSAWAARCSRPRLRRAPANPAEHAAPDLAPARPHPGPADRAPEAFRPDPTAVPTKAEYDSLRPATLPVT